MEHRTGESMRRPRSPILRAFAVAVVAGLTLGLAVPAIAGTAYSSWGYYTVSEIDYRNQAWVRTDSSSVLGGSYAETYPQSAHVAVPAGWIGCFPRIYKSNGSVYKSGTWSYNSSTSQGWSAATIKYSPAKGAYYSYGQTAAWTGSAYKVYNTRKSPSQTY
jgi:hypothetical protein